ncbi:MAG: MFS transporter [Pseudomonadota bacterium]
MLTRNAVIGLLSFLTLIDLFGAQALLPKLTAAYGVDPATMGFAVNATTLGMAAAGLAVAYFSRHIDRKTGIWISLALLSVPTFLLGIVEDLTLFTVLRIVQGLLMSAAFTLTMAYLAERCSAAEAVGAMAAYITGNVVSNLLGRLMAASFADMFGLSGSFWAFAALNLLGAALAAHCLTQATPREAEGPGESPFTVWGRHLANPALQAGFAIGFLILFVFLSVFTYVNYVLASPPFDLTSTQLGLVYFVFLPAVLTTPFAGTLVTRYGVIRTFVLSMGVAAIGIAGLLSPNLGVVLFGLALVGVGTFCAQAAVTGFIGSAAATDRAAASGLYLASYYLGGLVGAFVVGRIFAAAGWGGSVAAVLVATALSFLFATRLRQSRLERTPT